MAEENKVTLHGMWASPYMKRVELALKIKAISFEYVEEDLLNKSSLLLQYNPVYKKVPVLVHNGNPLSESLVILEYIDEAWDNKPRLIPEDPYERAVVRFWADYIQQVAVSRYKMINAAGEEGFGEACEELYEKLRVLEEGMKDLFPRTRRVHGSWDLGLLDILVFSLFGADKAYEEGFGIGTQILHPMRNPILHSWVTSLMELPVIKEAAIPHDKLVSLFQVLKQANFKFSTN